ncbi:MAG TPA: hypothetical protein VNG13_01640 [Mycobacteriales bacterium]|nr:hypothetical protein [Mycobacteriales bacterium]
MSRSGTEGTAARWAAAGLGLAAVLTLSLGSASADPRPLVTDLVVANTDHQLAATDQVIDSEPAIAVDPSQPGRVAAFSGHVGPFQPEEWMPNGCAPDPVQCPLGALQTHGSVWTSGNDGTLWTKTYSVPLPPGATFGANTNDRVLAYDRTGHLIGAFLTFDKAIYAASATDPTQPGSWTYPTNVDGSVQAVARHDEFLPPSVGPVANPVGQPIGEPFGTVDQPQIAVAPDPLNPSRDNVYIAYEDDGKFYQDLDPRLSLFVATSYGSAPLNFTAHHQLWSTPACCTDLPRPDPQTTAPLSNVSYPAIRLAADRQPGPLYALWGVSKAIGLFPRPYGAQFDTQMGTSALVQYHVDVSLDGGRSWLASTHPGGYVVDTAFSSQTSDKFATINGLYGGTHAAGVDPRTGDLYYVYGAIDPTTEMNRLAMRRVRVGGPLGLTVGPQHFVTGQVQAALPGVAVTDDGTVGVLYDAFDGFDPAGYPLISVHLARTGDGGQSFSDTVLTRFRSVEKENPNDAGQRPLGDYQQLTAQRDSFYGIFTVNGQAFGRAAPNWDVAFVRAGGLDQQPAGDDLGMTLPLTLGGLGFVGAAGPCVRSRPRHRRPSVSRPRLARPQRRGFPARARRA